MSLTIEPARAAAILLPILMLMDATALRPWWGKWDTHNLRTTAPGAVLGTLIGLATFDLLSPDALRVMIGSIALVFALRWWLVRDSRPSTHAASYARGTFWSTLAGFTSFSVHAGGPPTAYLPAVTAARHDDLPGDDGGFLFRGELAQARPLHCGSGNSTARTSRPRSCSHPWRPSASHSAPGCTTESTRRSFFASSTRR